MERTISHYPFSILFWDYARALAGLAIVGLIFFTSIDAAPGFRWFVLGLGILFLLFLIQTIWRQAQRIVFDQEGIALLRPFLPGKHIQWRNIRNVRLRYWGKRRKKNGVLALTFGDGESKIVIEDGLLHFSPIVKHIASLASAKKMEFDEITTDNMIALKQIWGENDAITDGARP